MFVLAAMGAAAVLQEMPKDAPAWQSIPVALLAAAVVGTLCGTLNGALIVGLRMHPFIVTLGTMSIFRGIANVATTIKTLPAPGKAIPDSYTAGFMRLELDAMDGLRPVPLIVMIACVLVGWFYLSALVAGRETYAIGGNEEAARFSGLRVGRIKLRVYALMGLAAGVAAWVSLGWFGTVSSVTGTGYELSVIAAAVVGGASLTGGRGSALGALLGALIIQMISNGIYILHWDEDYRLIIIGSAIIVAVAVDRLSEYWRARRMTRMRG
jgi:ribose/xylose/arabinose/galactoside ABC-type transport system permease subunit